MKPRKKSAKALNLARPEVLRRAKKPKVGDCFIRGKSKIVVLSIREGIVKCIYSGIGNPTMLFVFVSDWENKVECTSRTPTLFLPRKSK